MIYLETSVALAHLLAEDRCPPSSMWARELVTSRLLEVELWQRLHERGLGATHADPARLLLARLSWLEPVRPVLERALHPFPVPVRTSGAVHLASISFLRERGLAVELATYDEDLAAAARGMGVPIAAV